MVIWNENRKWWWWTSCYATKIEKTVSWLESPLFWKPQDSRNIYTGWGLETDKWYGEGLGYGWLRAYDPLGECECRRWNQNIFKGINNFLLIDCLITIIEALLVKGTLLLNLFTLVNESPLWWMNETFMNPYICQVCVIGEQHYGTNTKFFDILFIIHCFMWEAYTHLF